MAGATPGSSKTPALGGTTDLSKNIEYFKYFDAVSEPDTAQGGPAAAAKMMQKYDSLEVDVIAIHAGSIAVFEYSEQSLSQKSIKNNLSDQDDPKVPGHVSQLIPGHVSQTRASKASDTQPSKKVNWLIDENMLRSQFPVARIIGFCLNLRSMNDSMKSSDATIKLASLANEIGKKLQLLREGCGSRSIVFIGHGYGTLLIERLLNASPTGTLSVLAKDLKESTSAIGLFAPPSTIDRLIEWSSRSLGISRDATVFKNLQVELKPQLWSELSRHISSWNTLTFAERARSIVEA